MFLPERLKKIRKEKGLSQEDLVIELSKLGLRISRQTIWNWETGATTPNANDLSIVIQFFDKPIGYFFNKETYYSTKEK